MTHHLPTPQCTDLSWYLTFHSVVFFSQAIAVILAVFLYHGNGRAITSTSNDNFERMFDPAEEELNTVLNETNENSADFLTLSESDSPSYELVQSQFSSDYMIQPKEASPALRQKRSHGGPCYTGKHQAVTLASGGVKTFPVCKNVTLIGCESSIKKYGMRKCVGSEKETVNVRLVNGATQIRGFPRKCSCAK